MSKQTKETIIQKKTLWYKCPQCGGGQIITKPKPIADENYGCATIKSIVKCLNPKCDCVRAVKRYPNGTYISIKVEKQMSNT